MITCPWCGVTYPVFQPTCSQCGARLLASPASPSPIQNLPPTPPLPPRPIPRRAAWRLFLLSPRGVVALVFLILGPVFLLTGLPLLFVYLIGLPFCVLGAVFSLVGAWLGVTRYRSVQDHIAVLRNGQAVPASIHSVRPDYHVRVNRRYIWVTEYTFEVMGQPYHGQHHSRYHPGLEPGQRTWAVYQPGQPAKNCLYTPYIHN